MPKLKSYSVTTTLESGPRAVTPIGSHELIMDQPAMAGGTDEGPTPIDAFLATIGSCLGTISRMVARQQGIKLNKLEFTVSGDVDVDILLGRSQEGRAGFSAIKVDAVIESPDLDEAAKVAFLAEVDRRCPVSETILNGTAFEFQIQQPVA
ncbi:MAG: OsmC family protein [Akkermansiaceae bacterium]